MARRPGVLLLEVLVGLALLAAVGVGLLQVQAAALRQIRDAEQRQRLAVQVEQLLWTWSQTQTSVTLPATGRLDERMSWRRELRPVSVVGSVLATQVSVVIVADDSPREVYRVDWLVPERLREEPRP